MQVSRRAWLGFGTSMALCGAMWFGAHRWPATRITDDTELTGLLNEREHLRQSDDGTRDALRGQQQVIARQAWTAERLEALGRRLAPDWRWEWEPGNRPSRASLVRTAPRLEEWPRYLALVSDLSRQPGTVLESVELEAAGLARERRFTRMTIGLRFVLADPPNRNVRPIGPPKP